MSGLTRGCIGRSRAAEPPNVSHHITFSVRAAKPEDVQAACSAVRASIEVCCAEDHGGDRARLDAWLKNKTPETFRPWIQSDKIYCVVVEESSRIVGFGMSAGGDVLLCYVVPEVRFLGAGKAVLQAIERRAATSGVPDFGLRAHALHWPSIATMGSRAVVPLSRSQEWKASRCPN